MYESSARAAFYSIALGAAVFAVSGPPRLHLESGTATVAVLQAQAPPLAYTGPQAFASRRARTGISFPVPTPSRTAPRISEDLAGASVIATPAPTPTPTPAGLEATQQAVQPSASPYPTYTDLPSQSGVYGSAQAYAESLVGSAQFACLQPLWNEESGWNPYAQNPSSGAYGIPQALPGSKMASAGPDWQTNPDTQIRWGIQYLNDTYGSPCGGWAHEQAYGWY